MKNVGNLKRAAAVSCSPIPYCTAGKGLGLGLTGKLGLHRLIHGSVLGCMGGLCGDDVVGGNKCIVSIIHRVLLYS